MTEPLDIKLVAGWSVRLFEQNDPLFPWQVTAVRDDEEWHASGSDKARALGLISLKCGFDQREAMRAFDL